MPETVVVPEPVEGTFIVVSTLIINQWFRQAQPPEKPPPSLNKPYYLIDLFSVTEPVVVPEPVEGTFTAVSKFSINIRMIFR